MKTFQFSLNFWILVLAILATNEVFAQGIPSIKNAKTGVDIKLRPIPTRPVPIANPNGTPVASKQFTLANNSVKTVRLYKAPISKTLTKRATGGVTSSTPADPSITCTNTPMSAESGNFEVANFAPTDFIFPGNIVDGMTIPSGEYRQITAARNPMVISISTMNGGSAPVSASVEQPNVASVREAVNRLAAAANFSAGVELGETKTEAIYVKDEAAMAMDIHASSLFGSLSSSISTTTSAKKLTVIKIVKQRFYSIDIVPPTNEQDFFSDGATSISPNWTYVSSVKYGRVGVLVMQFETKEKEVSADLEAKAKSFLGSVSAQVDADFRSKFGRCEIRAFQFGGVPMNIAGGMATTPEAALSIFRQFDNWTRLPVGNPQPIAYSLRFVKYENGGPAIASLHSTLTYTRQRCVERQPRYEVTLREIKCIKSSDDDLGAGEDIYCTLNSKAFAGNNRAILPLFNKAELVLKINDCSTKSINTGNTYLVPDGTRFYDVPAADLDARITIGGDIDEDDDCGTWNTGDDDEYNDENGARTQKTIFFKDIGTNPTTIIFDHKHVSPGAHLQQIWTLKKIYL